MEIPSTDAIELEEEAGARVVVLLLQLEATTPGSCFITGRGCSACDCVMELSLLGSDARSLVDVHTAEAANRALAESRVKRDVGCDEKEWFKSKLLSESVLCFSNCSCWCLCMASNCSWWLWKLSR